MIQNLLTAEIDHLDSFLEKIINDGGKKHFHVNGVVNPLKFVDGMSGFEYLDDGIQGHLLVGLILGGTGFCLKRSIQINGQTSERNDYFNLKRELTFSCDHVALKAVAVDFYDMDVTCPILNHFYNYLSLEYRNATQGQSQTKLVHSVENLLGKFYKNPSLVISIENKMSDSAIKKIFNNILELEMDPVLTWRERQVVFNNYLKTLKLILNTKIRAHKLSTFLFTILFIKARLFNFIDRLTARPLDNIKGLIHQYSIGKIIWFLQTVRNNLGYSIALAVYGPFTYYFITMPMNPHAMQAVGKVRETYLETKELLKKFIYTSELTASNIQSKDAFASSNQNEIKKAEQKDSISTISSAPLKLNNNDFVLANIINPSTVATRNNGVFTFKINNTEVEKITPSRLNLPLTTDSKTLDQTDWSERMSQFKQMQIAYEENIEYASRMGRLEQLETQYNFPMQIEAAWEELERYNQQIFKIRAEQTNLSAKMKQYLSNEIDRTQQLQLYLWDRMGRFILDQIYVMLDKDKEQKRNDYYIGRSFIFMEEMTNILSWRYENFKHHQGHERIKELAQLYKSSRKEMGTVLKNLSANSNLFKQKDVFDTKEFRSYVKRQWEILFLQNAKAEEAANMGLNMYIWSVRNTAWLLQSFYSSKKEELPLLIKRDLTQTAFNTEEVLIRSKISMLFETQIHNMTLEYIGIREEMMNRLSKDIESVQRMSVINNLKEFLSDRDKLDNLGELLASKNNEIKQ